MADQTEVQKPDKESINLFIAGVPLTLQTWPKKADFRYRNRVGRKAQCYL